MFVIPIRIVQNGIRSVPILPVYNIHTISRVPTIERKGCNAEVTVQYPRLITCRVVIVSMLPHVPPTQSPLLFEHEQVEKVIRAVLESYIGDVTNENVKTGGETANRSRTMCTTSDEDGQKMECTQHERFVAYDGRQSAQLCVIISDQIRNRVKQLSYERYLAAHKPNTCYIS